MNPEQIIAALTEVYFSCSTYHDVGQVVTRIRYVEDGSPKPPRLDIRPFTTSFVRPGRVPIRAPASL